MSSLDVKFKRGLLCVSVILGIALLVGGVLLLSQIDTILGRNTEVVNEQPERPSVEGSPIVEAPESNGNGYTLRMNATDYQLELFDLLVNAHNQFYASESDENLKDYASAIVRNFVADFFTLSNKNSRSDVGGLQFFSEDVMDNFRSFAIDEFYLYLNQYIEMFGSESLPAVESTMVLKIEFGTQIIEMEDENGERNDEDAPLEEEVRTIIIDVEWSYGHTTLPDIDAFQTTARFVLVEHEESVKIYVIELIEIDYENYD